MSLAFTTAGRVAFRVTIRPTAVSYARFAEAVFRTKARVSHTTQTSKECRAIVWLKVTVVPQFENLCSPLDFSFLDARELIRGVPDTTTEEVGE